MIPSFNASGVLPPFSGSTPTDRASQAPYRTTMLAIAQRFGTSIERKAILNGLLDYRHELRARGLGNGFQWIDGSFIENVELNRGRPPADIDIVTVVRRPGGMSADDFGNFIDNNLDIIDPSIIKRQYKVDGYFIDLDADAEIVALDAVYWSGLFSHQRVTSLWKGMLSVSLESDDEEARNHLAEGQNNAQAA